MNTLIDEEFDWDCPSCGRHFEDMTTDEVLEGCPADDCPSHDIGQQHEETQ